MKQHIHTRIKSSTKEKLLKYGNGNINKGIEAVVMLSDDKLFSIKQKWKE